MDNKIPTTEALLDEDGKETPDQINLTDVTDNSAVSVQLGYGLIGMVDEATGGPLVNRITWYPQTGFQSAWLCYSTGARS
jgi:flagellar biosynthesis component FlhA